jgi:hypothetical protein
VVQRKRLLYFFISIGVGILLGGIFGWYLRPASVKEASFESLRSDYQTDYILMVAEVFKAEGDIALAKSQLNIISDEHPITQVQRGLDNARQLIYSDEDIDLIIALGQKLQEVTPEEEGDS